MRGIGSVYHRMKGCTDRNHYMCVVRFVKTSGVNPRPLSTLRKKQVVPLTLARIGVTNIFIPSGTVVFITANKLLSLSPALAQLYYLLR